LLGVIRAGLQAGWAGAEACHRSGPEGGRYVCRQPGGRRPVLGSTTSAGGNRAMFPACPSRCSASYASDRSPLAG
jgi:hypothetical protein